jgi:hypothetical protein
MIHFRLYFNVLLKSPIFVWGFSVRVFFLPSQLAGPVDLALLSPCAEYELNPHLVTCLAPVLLRCLLSFVSADFTSPIPSETTTTATTTAGTPSDECATSTTTASSTTNTAVTVAEKIPEPELTFMQSLFSSGSGCGEKREEKERATQQSNPQQRVSVQRAKKQQRMAHPKMQLGLLQVWRRAREEAMA